MKIKIENCAFVQVDVQERLFPFIANNEELEKNLVRLVKGLKTHKIPMLINEQYKKGLGETIDSLKDLVEEYPHFEKTTFSCCGQEEGLEKLKSLNKKYVILAGIETHVCVLQTALDLLEVGLVPVLVVDCVGSRKDLDKEIAIKRMLQAGVVLTTYESLLFELTQSSKHENFKEISKLVK